MHLSWLKRRAIRSKRQVRRPSRPRLGLEVLEDRCVPTAPGVFDPTSFTSLGALNLTSGTYTLNSTGSVPVLTDSGGKVLFTGTMYNDGDPNDPTVAVFDFDSITLSKNVTIDAVDGKNPPPVALLSRGAVEIDGIINVDGQNGSSTGGLGGPGGWAGGNGGPQGAPGSNGLAGLGPGGGAGGAAGYLEPYNEGVGAGHGGVGYDAGANSGAGGPGGPTYGGFAGGSGSGGEGSNLAFFGPPDGGGGGGGALAIDAAGTITLNGAIRANGGNGGATNTEGFAPGGSGGQVVLAAPTVDLSQQSDVEADSDTLAIEAKAGGPNYSGGGIVQFYTSTGKIGVYNTISQQYIPTNDSHLSQASAGGTVNGQVGTISFGTLPGSTQPPAITGNPINQSVTAGVNVAFTASASGSPTPTVQWQLSSDGGKTFSNISGAISATLTLNDVTAAMNGYEYRAVFTNSTGTVTSKVATLTVHTPLTVPTPPPSPPAPPTLNMPSLLVFFDDLLGGVIETVNTDGSVTETADFFGIPMLVANFDSSGNVESVTLFGIDLTFLFE